MAIDPHQALCEEAARTGIQAREFSSRWTQRQKQADGGKAALDHVFSATDEELRRLASAVKRSEMYASKAIRER
jgi:hypothetical protein